MSRHLAWKQLVPVDSLLNGCVVMQATMVPPCREMQHASDLLSTVQQRTTAIAAAHLRLAGALVATCLSDFPALLAPLRALYFEQAGGGLACASVLTSYAGACMDCMHAEAAADVAAAVLALSRLASCEHGSSMNCAVALRPCTLVRPIIRQSIKIVSICVLQTDHAKCAAA